VLVIADAGKHQPQLCGRCPSIVEAVLPGLDLVSLSRAEGAVEKISVGTMRGAKVRLDLNVEMVRKPENADHDQINSHYVVEQSRHNQNHNSSDQCDERIKDFHV
jgi:hypothetical protein